MRPRGLLLVAFVVGGVASHAQLGTGVPPAADRHCPPSHPVKAVVAPRTKECIYHVPGGQHYERTTPELCFASEEEAQREGCWRAEEVLSRPRTLYAHRYT